MNKNKRQSEAATLWWNNLTHKQREDVEAWILKNQPDKEWGDWTSIEWAYTECSKGLFTGRYGKIF